MSKVVGGLMGLLWSALSFAQTIPTVLQWIDVFQQVHKHRLFSELKIMYAKVPAADVGFSPVGVMPRAGVDCVIVISEGENPKMVQMMKLPTSPATGHAFLMAIAAHELGHCFRIRGGHLTVELWERVAVTRVGSTERRGLEKLLSIEEAYADAYAFAFIKDAHPEWYTEVFGAMHSLRHEPAFATPFYQVAPLYEQLGSRGLDARLPLHTQVETAIRESMFPLGASH